MKIILNNRDEVFDRDVMTVSDMITIKNFSFRLKIIKINGKLVSRDQYDSTYINDGDNVQMFYLMSGG
ncbi:MAG: sulfur carrier protein ThiS [Bacteroidales bacterium]|jgi:thiamine biosynthesis protein ThiS|nr:sulfur carrier protein ThiS [Bacteroidales bacterium]